jgi:DDE domain
LQNVIPGSEAVTLQAKISAIDPGTRAITTRRIDGKAVTVNAKPAICKMGHDDMAVGGRAASRSWHAGAARDRRIDLADAGRQLDFLLSAKCDAEAAKRFFRKALAQPHTLNPRTITVDKNPAYPKAAEMKTDGELWRCSRLRQVNYLNNIVEQDRRRIKRLIRPGLGFGGFWTARRTLAGDGHDQEGASSEHRRKRQ